MSQDGNDDLFGNTSSDAGEWEIVDNSVPEKGAENPPAAETVAPEVPVSPCAPQTWEDIPAEDPGATPAGNPGGDAVPDGVQEPVPENEMTEAAIPEPPAPVSTGAPQIWEDIPAETPDTAPAEMPANENPAVPETLSETADAAPAEDPDGNAAAETGAATETLLPVPEETVPEETVPEETTAEKNPATATPAPDLPGDNGEETPAIHYRHVAPDGIAVLEDMGRYLARIRNEEKLSPDEVCDATKIRLDYLEAIETGDVSELPQAVYVLAYIRKLCDLYSIDTSGLGDFFNDLRDGFAYELPEDINKSIVGHENDEEQQKKLRQLALALISSAAIVLLAIIVGIVVLLVGAARSGVFSSGSGIPEAEIVEMQGEPALPLYAIPARRR
ncbi:MAG: helix-turn-helix domain-containing protein [Victivallaceae bacterium]|nr:helix-turn-helix domain-containing protein [Victivallaceae bacterium]